MNSGCNFLDLSWLALRIISDVTLVFEVYDSVLLYDLDDFGVLSFEEIVTVYTII